MVKSKSSTGVLGGSIPVDVDLAIGLVEKFDWFARFTLTGGMESKSSTGVLGGSIPVGC